MSGSKDAQLPWMQGLLSSTRSEVFRYALQALEALKAGNGGREEGITLKRLGLATGLGPREIGDVLTHLNNVGYVLEFRSTKGDQWVDYGSVMAHEAFQPEAWIRLASIPDVPCAEEVVPRLRTRFIGKTFLYYGECGSTNDVALKASPHLEHGSVVVSEKQTKGRGRLGRVWHSAQGGLWFSVLLHPTIRAEEAMFLTMTASISVVEGMVGTLNIPPPTIKWPNDIIIHGKKVCGILTEFRVGDGGEVEAAVVGIGINVNNTLPPDLREVGATLADIVGGRVDRRTLLAAILNKLEENYNTLRGSALSMIKEKWHKYARVKGRFIMVREGGKEWVGVVKGLTDMGALIVITDDGVVELNSGDVEYL